MLIYLATYRYNNTSYTIGDINFEAKPTDTFSCRGEDIRWRKLHLPLIAVTWGGGSTGALAPSLPQGFKQGCFRGSFQGFVPSSVLAWSHSWKKSENDLSSILVYHFYSMHSFFALPGWHHECILKTEGVSHLGLVFIAVPWASPRACKRAHTLLKGKQKRE